MKSILEKLYLGKIYPYESYRPIVETLKQSRDATFNTYSELKEELPIELKPKLNRLVDEYVDLLPLEMQQNFIEGFRIGVQIMAEVYLSEK